MKKKKQPKSDIAPIIAKVIIAGKVSTAEGATVKEAVANLRPGVVNGKAIISITKDGETRERVIMPIMARRLFNTSGLSQEVMIKNISMIF